MKALQFQVTIAIPDGFVPPSDPDTALFRVIQTNMARILSDPDAIVARNLPENVHLTVTEEIH